MSWGDWVKGGGMKGNGGGSWESGEIGRFAIRMWYNIGYDTY